MFLRIFSFLTMAFLFGSCVHNEKKHHGLNSNIKEKFLENPFFLGESDSFENDIFIVNDFDMTLTNGFDQIVDVYYRPVDPISIVLGGVHNLSRLDPALDVLFERRNNRAQINLTHHGQEIGTWRLSEADTNRLSTVLVAAVRASRQASILLRSTDDEAILEHVFAGMIQPLDKFSRYVGRQNGARDRISRDGAGNIGLKLRRDDERIVIERYITTEQTTGFTLQPGDELLALDHMPVMAWSLEKIRDYLQGPVGSVVVFDIRRRNHIIRNLAMVRAHVIHNTVVAQNKDHIGFLAIERFNAATANHLEQAIRALQASDPNLAGLVLDLRGNPGGLLDQAVNVVDLFVDQGTIISTRGRHQDSYQHFTAHKGQIASNLPMVVLVDGGSASAAEVVASALQDHGRALVVGTASYGKGSVQTVTNLANDGELFVTWSEIFTPSGASLNRRGVIPNICSLHLSNAVSEKDLIKDMQRQPIRINTEWHADTANAEPMLASMRNACPAKTRNGDHDDDRRIAIALIHHPQTIKTRTGIAASVPQQAKAVMTAGR